MQSERVVVITDVHGCCDECRGLLKKLGFNRSSDRLISLGDTIDRGPKIYETFCFLRELKEEMGGRCVLLRGNHEQMMLDAVRGTRRDKKLWYLNSGEKTQFDFINHKHQIREFWDWYNEMPLYYRDPDGRFICVHACLHNEDPEKNSVETMIWGRDTDYTGKLVLTGHTPYKVPLYFHGRENIGQIREGVWGSLPATGMMAIDTGCVYGNRLTGVMIDGDRFLTESVASTVSSGR